MMLSASSGEMHRNMMIHCILSLSSLATFIVASFIVVASAGRDRWRPRRIVWLNACGSGPMWPRPFDLDRIVRPRWVVRSTEQSRPTACAAGPFDLDLHLLFRHYLDQRLPQDAWGQMQVQLSSLDVWQIRRKTDRRARRISSSHFLLQRPLQPQRR